MTAKGLSGNALKDIAIIAMTIDHLAWVGITGMGHGATGTLAESCCHPAGLCAHFHVRLELCCPTGYPHDWAEPWQFLLLLLPRPHGTHRPTGPNHLETPLCHFATLSFCKWWRRRALPPLYIIIKLLYIIIYNNSVIPPCTTARILNVAKWRCGKVAVNLFQAETV